MRTLSALLAFSLAVAPSAVASSAPETDAAHASSYLKTLPNIPPPVIDQAQIVTLAALPLSCIDAGYLGHWLATYAVLYMQQANLTK